MGEEKIKDINKEAYKQAEQELMENKVKQVKSFILETLEKIEHKKQDKEKIEEELRILKLDLEDLRSGKFSKIEERIEKSKIARGISVNPIMLIAQESPVNDWEQAYIESNWNSLTAGTYNVCYTNSNGTIVTRTFYF